MSGADLGLHEEVLLLAVRDAEGTVDPRAVHWGEAFAAATFAELVLAGRLDLDERGGGLLTFVAGPVPDDPILAKVLARVKRFKKAATLAWWTDRLARDDGLRVATAEGLARRGILSVRRRGGIPFLSPKSYPARDMGPETALRADLKRASLRPAPSPRDSARLALVVVGDLVVDLFPVTRADGPPPRLRRAIRANPIGRAIVDAVGALHTAHAASELSRARAIDESWRSAVRYGMRSRRWGWPLRRL